MLGSRVSNLPKEPRGTAPSGGSEGEAPTTGREGGRNTLRRGGAALAPSREAQPRAVPPPTYDRARNQRANTINEHSRKAAPK